MLLCHVKYPYSTAHFFFSPTSIFFVLLSDVPYILCIYNICLLCTRQVTVNDSEAATAAETHIPKHIWCSVVRASSILKNGRR